MCDVFRSRLLVRGVRRLGRRRDARLAGFFDGVDQLPDHPFSTDELRLERAHRLCAIPQDFLVARELDGVPLRRSDLLGFGRGKRALRAFSPHEDCFELGGQPRAFRLVRRTNLLHLSGEIEDVPRPRGDCSLELRDAERTLSQGIFEPHRRPDAPFELRNARSQIFDLFLQPGDSDRGLGE